MRILFFAASLRPMQTQEYKRGLIFHSCQSYTPKILIVFSGGQSSTEASVGQTMKTLETQLPASQEANLGLISCTVKWWATVSTIFGMC